jgi:hypothetical protein
MENAPVITFSGRNIPQDIEERYNRWYDAAYAPLYLKNRHVLGIDRYRIIRANYTLPSDLVLYHADKVPTPAVTRASPLNASNTSGLKSTN